MSTAISAEALMGGIGSDPADFAWDVFCKAFLDACKDAWDDDHRDVVAVTLPLGVFPGISRLQSPITRTVVQVRRVEMFEYAAAPFYMCAGAGLSDEELRVAQDEVNAVLAKNGITRRAVLLAEV